MSVLRASTTVNADVFGLVGLGRVAEGHQADLIVVPGHPDQDITALRKVVLVMLKGNLVKQDF